MGTAIHRARVTAILLTAAFVAATPAASAAGSAAPDGGGGSIVVWTDSRSDAASGLYAQRVDAGGTPLWTAGGVPVCLASGGQAEGFVVSDGAGGAFVAWQDGRGAGLFERDIYVQHLDANGAALWAADGVLACGANDQQDSPQVVPDGSGGMIVAWRDDRHAASELYAQRFDAAGTPQWDADGVPVIGAGGPQQNAVLLPDAGSGAFVAWQDHGSGTWQVFAQRLAGDDGSGQWPAGGVLVCDGSGEEAFPSACPDGAGGWFVAWEDARSPGGSDVYAQRLDAGGACAFASDGVPVCAESLYQMTPQVLRSGSGAIVCWIDGRAGGTDYDLYTQRLGPTGALRWDPAGVAVCAAPAGQGPVVGVGDDADGAIFCWQDRRRSPDADLYAQRVDSTGAAAWGADGVAVSTDSSFQFVPSLVSDGSGGAIVAWPDLRSRLDLDTHVQRLRADGTGAWTPGGVALHGQGWQRMPLPVPVGGGNVVLVWMEKVNGQYDLWARKIDSANGTLWGPLAVCSAPDLQLEPVGCSDGSGGAILAWLDGRAGEARTDVYAQRIDASGTALWAADGVPLCAAAGHRSFLSLQSDVIGGGVLGWLDDRSGTHTDVYAQRVNPAGQPLWTADGVAVCTAAGDKEDVAIAQDGSRGLFLAWRDTRAGYTGHVYAQWVDSTGTPKWTADGVSLSTSGAGQGGPAITQGVNGGAVVVWNDARDDASDLYAQRLSRGGALRWDPQGLALAVGAGRQASPAAVNLNNLGTYVAWTDTRGGSGADVYAQRIDSTGAGLWNANGNPACLAGGDQQDVRAIRDSGNGLVLAWSDHRSGSGWDVYAQRLDSGGAAKWAADGIPVADTAWAQERARISSDARGGACLVWEDLRDGVHRLAYVQRVDSLGVLQWGSDGVTSARFSLASSSATPDAVRIEWVVTGTATAGATVERREPEGVWLALADVSADGTGMIRFVDREVAPGARYAYRLRVQDPGGEHTSPEVWIEVPGLRVALALHGVHPQPVTAGPAAVSFALSGAGAAALELIDVMGRRVRRWPLTGLAAGEHVRPLDGMVDLPAGVYLLRLREGDASVHRRVVRTR